LNAYAIRKLGHRRSEQAGQFRRHAIAYVVEGMIFSGSPCSNVIKTWRTPQDFVMGHAPPVLILVPTLVVFSSMCPSVNDYAMYYCIGVELSVMALTNTVFVKL